MVHLEMIESDKKNPWLLFIHGFGGSHQMWNKQVNIYKDKFNICLVDLPGHAGIELTKKSLESANIFKDVAKSIVEQIRAYGIQKITTISVSLGTLINYFMLKYDSDLIDEAVLSGAICGTTVGYKTIMKSVELLKNIMILTIYLENMC